MNKTPFSKNQPIVLTLRIRRILIPFAIGIFIYIGIDQMLLREAFTVDKQIETLLGVVAAYLAASVPTLPITIGSSEEHSP